MSHWAEIDDAGLVLRVLVGDNDEPDEGQSFVENLGGKWVKTSYNGKIRKNYAGVGYTYDAIRDAFIPVKCHEIATLNEITCQWNCNDDSHQL